MIAWVLYTLVVSVLVVLGARAAESIGRSLAYPVRWVWAGAFALLLALATIAPLRATPRARQVELPAPAREIVAPVVTRRSSWTALVEGRLAGLGFVLNDRVERTARTIEQRLPARAPGVAVALTSIVSALVLALFSVVQLRFRRARRAWPVTDVHGVRVRVAPNVGPVVIGVVRPEIVVPRWLLARAPHEQRMVVAHEAEHVRARDTLLLGAGCLVVAAMPWNPLVWYMLSRLRLAVELDCDARVLGGGAAPLSYGSLLIDVAASNSGARLGAPALADDSSHLKQRIMAMHATRPRFAIARAGAFGALALAALLAACEAKMPTSADVDAMDAASAERAATRLAMLKGDSLIYLVDGEETEAEKANRITPDLIASIQVKKSPAPGGPNYIIIDTKEHHPVRFDASMSDSEKVAARKAWVASHDGETAGTPRIMRKRDGSVDPMAKLFKATSGTGAKPLLYVDGVKKDADAIKSIDPNTIESVEVIKGTAAAAYVNDPDAVNGVIVIKTKKM